MWLIFIFCGEQSVSDACQITACNRPVTYESINDEQNDPKYDSLNGQSNELLLRVSVLRVKNLLPRDCRKFLGVNRQQVEEQQRKARKREQVGKMICDLAEEAVRTETDNLNDKYQQDWQGNGSKVQDSNPF